jgi:hypothetical protein
MGHILPRNCLLKHVTEGKIKGKKKEEENIGSYCLASRKKEYT